MANRLLMFFAKLMISLAGVGIFITILFLFDDDTKRSAILGMLLFSGLLGIPGGVWFYSLSKRNKRLSQQNQIIGWIRARHQFTLDELVTYTGWPPMQTEAELYEIVQTDNAIDLVYQKNNQTFMHRSDVEASGNYTIHSQCDSCGAKLPNILSRPTDPADCIYCGAALK